MGRRCKESAKRVAAVIVMADLRGRDHIGAGLDGAGALQHVPMRLAGLAGEAGGRGEDLGAGVPIGSEELRKADIVADAEAEPAERQVDQDGRVAPT